MTEETIAAWVRWLRDPNRSYDPNAYELLADVLEKAVGAGGVQALSAAQAGPWSLGEIDGNWRDIDLPDHGAVMRIVWKMEDGEVRNDALEAQAHAVVAELNASSSAPPAERQATQVIIDFPQVGVAGPFSVVDGRVSLPDSTMQDLVRMLRPTYAAEQQAEPGAVDRTGCTAGTDEECTRRGCATSCPAQQAAPKAAPGEPSNWPETCDGKEQEAWEACASRKAAPQQEAHEPVAYAIFAENGNIRLWATEPQHVKRIAAEQGLSLVGLYTAPPPQPAPAPLSDDSALLDWIAIHGSFGVDSSTGKVGGNGQKCVAATRKNIRAALAAQGGKDAG